MSGWFPWHSMAYKNIMQFTYTFNCVVWCLSASPWNVNSKGVEPLLWSECLCPPSRAGVEILQALVLIGRTTKVIRPWQWCSLRKDTQGSSLRTQWHCICNLEASPYPTPSRLPTSKLHPDRRLPVSRMVTYFRCSQATLFALFHCNSLHGLRQLSIPVCSLMCLNSLKQCKHNWPLKQLGSELSRSIHKKFCP